MTRGAETTSASTDAAADRAALIITGVTSWLVCLYRKRSARPRGEQGRPDRLSDADWGDFGSD
jgi:hypothetical protein